MIKRISSLELATIFIAVEAEAEAEARMCVRVYCTIGLIR